MSLRRVSFVLGFCAAVSTSSLRGQPTFSEQGQGLWDDLSYNSRSASVADVDDDGDLDVMFQGTMGARLLRSNLVETDELTFTDISGSLSGGLGPSWSAAWGDYDGDGQVDVFVGQSNSGSATGDVLQNAGGSFLNQSSVTGLDDPGFHQNVAWSDIDNDLDLDLIIGMEGPEKHEIYLQESRRGTFSPVGAEVGFQELNGTHGYGMAIGDTDGDGDMDIYISTCEPDGTIRNNFYVNQLVETGSLSFIDIADSNGTQYLPNSYGAEFHDFDDDGDLDLFMVGADGNPSKIWRNDGSNMFTDVDTLTGHSLLADTAGDLNGARAVDYDNDGDLDLFFHDHKPSFGNEDARKLYRNDGDWTFTDVTAAEGIAAGNEGAYDSVWADIDRDGDQDLIAPTDGNFDERAFISNASENGNHWLYVELNGPSHNTTGIGAAVYATFEEGTPEERTLRREANTNAGTFNQSDLPVHFGLGAAEMVDTLKIHWPDGNVQLVYDVEVDQYLAVTYSDGIAGDYNDDGIVNAADYVLWRNHLGQETALPNEVTTPGMVTQEDYTHWLANFGAAAGQGAADDQPVPEPAAVVLAIGALLGAVTTRHRS